MRDTFLFREKGDASVSKRRTSSFPTLFANFPAAFCRLAVSYRARYRVNRKSRTKGRKSRELRRGCEARPRRLAHERSAARLLHIYAHASVACDFSRPSSFLQEGSTKAKASSFKWNSSNLASVDPWGQDFYLTFDRKIIRSKKRRARKQTRFVFPAIFPLLIRFETGLPPLEDGICSIYTRLSSRNIGAS